MDQVTTSLGLGPDLSLQSLWIAWIEVFRLVAEDAKAVCRGEVAKRTLESVKLGEILHLRPC